VPLRVGEVAEFNPTLRPTAALSGVLVDAGDRPLAEWTVVALEQGLRGNPMRELRRLGASTDATGSFTMPGACRGVVYDVLAYPPDAGRAAAFPATAMTLAVQDAPHRCRVGSDGLAHVQLADIAVGTSVWLAHPMSQDRLALAPDPTHRVAVAEVPPGAYLLEFVGARGDRRVLPWQLAAGVNRRSAPAPEAVSEAVLRFPPELGEVHVRLFDAHGTEHLRSRGRGDIALGVLAVGDYTLRTFGSSIGAAVQPLTLAPGAGIIVPMLPAATARRLNLHIPFLAADNPLLLKASLAFTLRDERGRCLLQDTLGGHPDGTFRLELPLLPGRYTLAAVALWGARATQTIEVEPGSAPVRCTAELQLP
jgi:hypothetical protein